MGIVDHQVSSEVRSVASGKSDIDISPIEIKTNRRRFSGEAGNFTVKGISDTVPGAGETLEIDVNETRIATGRIEEATETDDGLVKVKALDGTRQLRQTNIVRDWTEKPALNAARDIAQEVGLDFGTDFDQGQFTNLPVDSVVIDDSIDKSGVKAMNIVRNHLGGVWYVDAENVLQLRSDPPTDEFDIDYVLESDAGQQVPPFTKIVVTGNPVKIGENRCIISDDPPQASAELPTHGEGGEVEHISSNDIKSEAAARNVANAVISEMQKQQKKGTIKFVGNEAVSFYDVVDLPEVKDLSGDSYIATGVNHDLSGTNGFTTSVRVGSRASQNNA